MILVIDANILFAALIRDSATREILLFSGHSFYAPEYTLNEFEEKTFELTRKTGMEKDELVELIESLVRVAGITFVPLIDFKEQKQKAIEITPDSDDVAYLALALHLNCPLWTNDKDLKKQSVVAILTTKELVEYRL
jgi:predicted nucleic acid-binding protein